MVGDDTLSVRLFSESSNGVVVQLDSHPGVYEGEMVWLRIEAGWTEARVVRIVATPEGAHLGLECLQDLQETPRETAAQPARPAVKVSAVALRPPRRLRPLPQIGSVAPIVIGLALFMVLVLVPFLHTSLLAPVRMLSIFGAGNDAAPALTPDKTLAAQQAIESLGARVFLADVVDQVLELSPSQRNAIREIAAQLKRSLKPEPEHPLTAEAAKRLRLESLHEAEQTLTPAQRNRWHKLLRLLSPKSLAAPSGQQPAHGD